MAVFTIQSFFRHYWDLEAFSLALPFYRKAAKVLLWERGCAKFAKPGVSFGFICRAKTKKRLTFFYCCCFLFSLMLILKTEALAPIVAKILLCRGSAQKIVVDSGNSS